MTTFDRRSLPVGPEGVTRPGRRLQAELADASRHPERFVFGLPLATGVLGLMVALLSMFINATDGVMAPLLGLVGLTLAIATGVRRRRLPTLDRASMACATLSLLAAVVVALLPTWMYGSDVNGIVHRTVVSGPLLLALASAAASLSIRRLMAATPSGQDLALVPLLAVAVFLGVVGYVFVLGRVLVSGLGSFQVGLLTTAWHQFSGSSGFSYSHGFLNNILGTFLLIVLTLLFAILPGVGAGVLMSEYPGRAARVIGFCVTMLRAIAMFILGVAAFSLVTATAGNLDTGTFLSQLIRGGYFDGTQVQGERGSFVLAAMFLALLVMPVIARLTEEGLRSVPREIREGSVALGASDGYGLRRILLPWAAPNILTALILAGAEAAGGLAVIMFLAGPGQNGVGPLSNVTTLDYAVFATTYGPRVYVDSMRTYQFTAALLLLALTVALTLSAMALQRHFAARYRGSITVR